MSLLFIPLSPAELADWAGGGRLDWPRPGFSATPGLRSAFETDDEEDAEHIALLVASVAGKLAGVRLAGRLLGWPAGDAALVGWLLQTKALIMIIFANVLLDKQIITNETFTALLLMAVGSTMLTIPRVTPMLARLQGVLGRGS